MTTIAFDGKTLAADKQITIGNMRETTSKLYMVEGKAIGIAGDAVRAMEIISWMLKKRKGKKPELGEDECVEFLVVDLKTGQSWVTDNSLALLPYHAPCAIGSGSMAAVAVMKMGFDAVKAVEVASLVDACTGCGVDTINVIEKKKRLK